MNRILASLGMLAIALPSPQKLVKGGNGIVGDMEVSCVDRSLGTIALS